MKDLLLNLRSQMRGPILILIVIWVAYVIVSLFAPTLDAQSRFGVTAVQANLLKVTVYLPYLFIWLGALLAVLSFRSYSKLVANSPESKGYRRMYKGLAFLGLAIFIPALILVVRNYNPSDEPVVKMVTIVYNYASVALYLAAFWNILQGSRDLNKTLQLTSRDSRSSLTVITLVVILSVVYVWAVFHNPTRTVSNDELVRPTYYLSDIWILLTIIIPYVLVWIWGGLAITNLLAYAKAVPGQIYRAAFGTIARGLTVIICFTILVQFLPAAGRYFARANLGAILLIIYVLLIVIAVGYILVAKGASKLSNIEKI